MGSEMCIRDSLTPELLVCGEPERENQPCIAESGQTTTGKPKFCFRHSTSGDIDAWSVAAKICNRCYHTRCYHTPVCLEYGSKTRLKPLLSPPTLSHPSGIPPGVVNILKSQTTAHFITGGTVFTTPPRYTTPGDKIPKPKILSPGVWYTLSYTVGQLGVRPNWSIYTSIQQYEYCCTSTSQAA